MTILLVEQNLILAPALSSYAYVIAWAVVPTSPRSPRSGKPISGSEGFEYCRLRKNAKGDS